MKCLFASITVVVVASTAVSAIPPIATDDIDDLLDVKNRCIVRFDDNADSNSVSDLTEKALGKVNKFNKDKKEGGGPFGNNRGGAKAKHMYKKSIKGFTMNLPCSVAEKVLKDDASVTSFIPDEIVTIDALRGGINGERRLGRRKKKKRRTTPAPTPTPETTSGPTPAPTPVPNNNLDGTPKPNVARVGGPRDGTGYTAWIIDTGIDLNHPSLNVDTTYAFNSVTNEGQDDVHGHGTHVAGTIAATSINGHLMGIAPGAKVVPVKVMNASGSGSISGILAGIDHVAGNAQPGDCINFSIGASVVQALDDAVVDAAARTGAYFVVAAGNSASDANNFSPARAAGTNVFTISAIDSSDRLASFSNFGSPVDYAAPGVNILSTYLDGSTAYMSGTSMAAPAACAVLMLTGGSPGTSGTVQNDADNVAEPIIHL